jgi:hypothetical protein
MEVNTQVRKKSGQHLKEQFQEGENKSEIVAKLIRVSDATYKKFQKAQRPRETYGDVADRAIDALLEKEGISPEDD